MRTAIARRLAVVVTLGAALALSVAGATSAAAAPAAVAGTIDCHDNAQIVKYPHAIQVNYTGPGYRLCSYSSEYQWMVDSRNDIERGIDGRSRYDSVYVLDGATDRSQKMRADALFVSSGAPGRPNTVVTRIYEDAGPAVWSFGYQTTCSQPSKLGISTEARGWAYFMQNLYHAWGTGDFKSTFLEDNASGNRVTEGSC